MMGCSLGLSCEAHIKNSEVPTDLCCSVCILKKKKRKNRDKNRRVGKGGLFGMLAELIRLQCTFLCARVRAHLHVRPCVCVNN